MKFNKYIMINDKVISNVSPAFIIAEAGVNHNGDIESAKKLVDVAVEANVDAVKFQTFKTEELILADVKKAVYQTKTTSNQETQYEMLKQLEVTVEENKELKRYCLEKDIIFLTTPFDEKSLEELDELDLPAYKIASTDLTNIPFLIKIAKKNKPIFLSTGMSYLDEIKSALNEIYKYNKNVILLQCTANYPIIDEEANLNVLDTFKQEFEMLLGYSDHTVGIGASPYALSKGVKVIEKHFTLSKESKGPDHKASLSPEQLREFVKVIRKAEKYMGTDIKMPSVSEANNRKSLQKCFVAKKIIRKGDILSDDNIIAKRTGGEGISPIYYKQVFGKKSEKDYAINEII